jgi:hypothetical protein
MQVITCKICNMLLRVSLILGIEVGRYNAQHGSSKTETVRTSSLDSSKAQWLSVSSRWPHLLSVYHIRPPIDHLEAAPPLVHRTASPPPTQCHQRCPPSTLCRHSWAGLWRGQARPHAQGPPRTTPYRVELSKFICRYYNNWTTLFCY